MGMTPYVKTYEEEPIDFKAGTYFFHGSPYFFETLKSGSYFSSQPTLSLAILTEKCEKYGYYYIFKSTKSLKLFERDPFMVPITIWLSQPIFNVDELITKYGSKAISDYEIASGDNGSLEFLYQDWYNFDLVAIYKIDVGMLRQRVKELFLQQRDYYIEKKIISIERELELVKDFLPNIPTILKTVELI